MDQWNKDIDDYRLDGSFDITSNGEDKNKISFIF